MLATAAAATAVLGLLSLAFVASASPSHESTFEKEINTIDGNENIEVSPWSLSPDKSFHVRVVKYMKRGIVNCVVTQTQRFKTMSPTYVRIINPTTWLLTCSRLYRITWWLLLLILLLLIMMYQ